MPGERPLKNSGLFDDMTNTSSWIEPTDYFVMAFLNQDFPNILMKQGKEALGL